MDIQEFANMLDGRDYGKEITKDEEKQAKELGFVVVFGASDDLAEFRGAMHEEADCLEGAEILLDKNGLFQDCECNCNHSEKAKGNCKSIKAFWCKNGFSWTYATDIPHATFDILEDEEKYCKGIVFEIKSLE